MAGTIDIPTEYPKYGAVYGEETSNVGVDLSGGGLDITGMVGTDFQMGVFFDYTNLTGYTFSAFVVLDPPPLQRTYPLTVSAYDPAVGMITVSLSMSDTGKIGPVADKPWFLQYVSPTALKRTVMMGRLQLNRQY